jgi:hypothetical protein
MMNLSSPIVENASQRKGKVSNEETRLHRDFGWCDDSWLKLDVVFFRELMRVLIKDRS